METKKSNRANLEKKRSVFFQVGLLLALGFALAAFEWQSAAHVSTFATGNSLFYDASEDIIITRTFTQPPPPPPAPPQPSFELEIVDDTFDVGDAFSEINWESGNNIISAEDFGTVTIKEEDEDAIFDIVESAPVFNGKMAEIGFREYIRDNMHYPQIAIDNGISGKVLVQFVVDQKGNVVDVQLIRGVDASLDNEALRLIKASSGMWVPGKQREKPVKVRFTFPIVFRLQ